MGQELGEHGKHGLVSSQDQELQGCAESDAVAPAGHAGGFVL